MISIFGEEITPEEADEVRRLFYIFSEPKIAKVMGKLHDQFDTDRFSEEDKKNAELLIGEWMYMAYPYEEDQSLFDLFLKDMEGKMDRRLLRKLESWKKSYVSIYEVIGDREGKSILLKDIFTHEEKVFAVDEGDQLSSVGEMEVIRLVPVAGVYEYFFGTFYLPLEIKDILVSLLEITKETHNKNWEEFLKENGDELIQLIMDTFERKKENDSRSKNLKEASKIYVFTPKETKELESILSRDWLKEIYREEARLFIEKTKGIYLPEAIIGALRMWWDYTKREVPNFRKQGVWAAALNENIDEIFEYDHYDSRLEIAEVYGVSPSSVGTYYHRLMDFLQALTSQINDIIIEEENKKAAEKKGFPKI